MAVKEFLDWEWTLGMSSREVKPRSWSSRFRSRSLLWFFVVRQPVSTSRSRRWPLLERVSCLWTYWFKLSSSMRLITRLRDMRKTPKVATKRPVASNSFHQPPLLHVTMSSGRRPEPIKKSPNTKKHTPRWSMPIEVAKWRSVGELWLTCLGTCSTLSMLLVWEESRLSRAARFFACSRMRRWRLMAIAEWRPADPCICNPRGESATHYTSQHSLHIALHFCTALYTVFAFNWNNTTEAWAYRDSQWSMFSLLNKIISYENYELNGLLIATFKDRTNGSNPFKPIYSSKGKQIRTSDILWMGVWSSVFEIASTNKLE